MANNHEGPFVAIARIVRPQGRRGEVVAELLTDFPDRFGALKHVYLETAGRSPSPAVLETAWRHKGRIVLKFGGVDSIQAAEHLRGHDVLIPLEDRVRLPENSYYAFDLVGCEVVLSSQSKVIGTVKAVEPTAGVALLHVSQHARGNKELLIPFAREICKHIDPEAKRIEIEPPGELMELNDR